MTLEEFDMEAAVDQIADGLGLEEEAGDSNTGLEGDGELPSGEVKEPAATTTTEQKPPEGEIPTTTEGEKATETATPTASDSTMAAPKTWRKEAAAIWETIPPAARAEIHKREEDIFKGIQHYKADATTGKAFQDAIAPYVETYRQHNIDPVQQVRGFFEAHMILSTASPEKKLEMFQKLAAHYGVPSQGMQTGTEYVDPQTAALQSKIQELEGRLQGIDQTRATEVRKQLEQELEAFATDPKNLYFNEVAGKVAQLLQQRKADSLAEAYEMAVYLDPVIRAKEQQRLEKERADAAKKEEQEKAAAAKKAMAANVKTTAKGKTPSATAPVGTMDATLEETLAAIKSKG